jgi:hypothetical protein
MRGNGLSASTYVAVADLDPRTADALLAELRERGVAAYAADSPDPGPRGRVDRLYVDAAAEDVVRTLIDEELSRPLEPGDDPSHDPGGPGHDPGGPGHDPGGPGGSDWPSEDLAVDSAYIDSAFIDSAFADIVADFNRGPGTQVGAWPADEDLDQPEQPGLGRPASDAASGSDSSAGSTGATRSYLGWDDLLRPEPAAAPDPEERYVPPPPPPLPHADLRTRIAWAAVLGGPSVLFAAGILGWHLNDMVLLLAAVAFLGGFVALVARLKDRPDDETDDGAVI